MAAEFLEKLKTTIIEGDRGEAVNAVKRAVDEGVPIQEIIREGLVKGIQVVGELFGKGEYYLPELLVSGKAMNGALEVIEPELAKSGESYHVGNFLIGTVRGDLHDIGKNIVIMMLKGSGWKVTDLGVDVPSEKICAAVETGGFDIFGMSALLTVTLPAAAETIEVLKNAGLRDKIKIMIGGAPVTQEFCDRIGADAYAQDAWEAVTKAQTLL
ncbi:B12-binding domain-containing protein [Thermodesulfobacteriota bacterium]